MKSDTEFQYMKVDEDTNTLVKGERGSRAQIRQLNLPVTFCPLLLIKPKSAQEHSLKYISLVHTPRTLPKTNCLCWNLVSNFLLLP